MRPALKLGLVAAGYAGAFVIASAAVALRIASTSGPVAQASSGMYAFGDAVLFVAMFGLLALVPTAAALFWLRPYRKFWVVLSVVSAVVAGSGAAAAVLFLLGRDEGADSALGAWASFSVLRILLGPVLAPTFFVVGLIAPYRSPRLVLLAAAIVELGVVAFAAFSWFVPLYFPPT